MDKNGYIVFIRDDIL